MIDAEVAPARPRALFSALLRPFTCIRVGEVCVLQGAPIIGALFALKTLSSAALVPLVLLVAGNLCLVGHVFVLNDWAGIETDMKDPTRSARTFRTRGASPTEMGWLALALLVAALGLFGSLGWGAFTIGALIALLSALYSVPKLGGGKGVPLLSSILHLAGGVLHFLLGYAAVVSLSWGAVATGGFFGLVFAAGHLTHETRDHDGDRGSGIRTNAVAFGKQHSFFASLALFALAYLLLALLALNGIVPGPLAPAAMLGGALHGLAALRAFRAGLTFDGLRRLQAFYRRLHGAIGLLMLFTALPWRL
ncbi:UbiA family prenyltransferase [Methylovirgula sp. 4M-Z18]|uniref:UbiA family prenyltransferase n=1 Tax=Methylovirgula sp. 4M-Z18 TaxID=2293567 RepID=UPI000E2E9892|nr:UbiA family prenyltransferase [Methylovirgula sp. 4M-Z18]RFB76497.1 hypothetical protein DYH55_20390 [Methylovirgula sp. 4M-Z18]